MYAVPALPKATHPGGRVLLILPDADEAARVARGLSEEGFQPAVLERLDPERLAHEQCDAWVVDPEAWPGDVVSAARAAQAALVLVASFGTVGDAVAAMKNGAADYLTRPLSAERLSLALRRALERRALELENRHLKQTLGHELGFGRILSRDPRMLELRELIESVADTRANLLISGESGTGKTLLARAIHQRSARAPFPFVEVNCGALPPTLLESELFGHVRGAFTGAVRDQLGRFEAAAGGTIFLDEIATAPLDLQVKLLRFLQDRVFERVGDPVERTADVRVIAASNRDLTEEVRAGRFREDLFYRINVVPIHLPPLRERARDVPLLAAHFLERFAREYARDVRGFQHEALEMLTRHAWPGNVRQLENTLERAVLLARGALLEARDLGPELSAPPAALPSVAPPSLGGPILPLKQALEAPERALILCALEQNGGNRSRTAAMLGLNRSTLFNKMRKYGLFEAPARPENSAPGHVDRHPAG